MLGLPAAGRSPGSETAIDAEQEASKPEGFFVKTVALVLAASLAGGFLALFGMLFLRAQPIDDETPGGHV